MLILCDTLPKENVVFTNSTRLDGAAPPLPGLTPPLEPDPATWMEQLMNFCETVTFLDSAIDESLSTPKMMP